MDEQIGSELICSVKEGLTVCTKDSPFVLSWLELFATIITVCTFVILVVQNFYRIFWKIPYLKKKEVLALTKIHEATETLRIFCHASRVTISIFKPTESYVGQYNQQQLQIISESNSPTSQKVNRLFQSLDISRIAPELYALSKYKFDVVNIETAEQYCRMYLERNNIHTMYTQLLNNHTNNKVFGMVNIFYSSSPSRDYSKEDFVLSLTEKIQSAVFDLLRRGSLSDKTLKDLSNQIDRRYV